MSYILEALKKSQQQRELGRAPRLEENWLEQMPDRERSHPWLIGTAVLAALALLVALYAVLRSGATTQTPVASPGIESPLTATGSGSGNGAAPDTSSQPSPEPPASEDPANLSVEPNILIVPAPDPQGRPLPRGAEEIRRAVLGEEFLPPQMSASVQPPSGVPLDHSRSASANFPQEAQVPEELKAEIEAFKQAVKQRGGTAAPKPTPPPSVGHDPLGSTQVKPEPEPEPEIDNWPGGAAASTPEPTNRRTAPSPATTSGPSPALRQRLPPYSVAVHVYNSAVAKRFVYINGNKMREQEVTPEGLKIEEITQAGVILSFEGEHFFERR